MPLKGAYKPTAPTPDPSFLDRMGGLRGLAATGTRVASGIGGSVFSEVPGLGTLAGAGIGGLGEGIAEVIEGSKLSPARMATEAALTAVPMGKVIKAGKWVQSALRSGAMSGVGEGMREASRGESLDPKAIGTHTALGGLLGVAMSHMGGYNDTSTPPPPKPEPFVVEPTARAGGRVLGDKGSVPATGVRVIPPAGPGESFERPMGPFQTGGGSVAQMGTPAEASGRVGKVIAREQKESDRLQGQDISERRHAARAEDQAVKIKDEERAAQDIADAKVSGELVPSEPSISESVSSPIPGGRERMSTRWTKPEEESTTLLDDEGGIANPTAPQGSPLSQMLVPRRGAAPQPPPEGPARAIYDEWVRRGVDPKQALKNAANGTLPINQPPDLEGELADIGQLKQTLDAEQANGAVEATAPPTTPLGKVLTPQQQAREESYNALLAKLKGEQAPPAEPVQAPVPEPPAIEPEVRPEPAQTEPIAQPVQVVPQPEPEPTPTLPPAPQGPVSVPVDPESAGLTQLFKSRVDASGSHYRDLKNLVGGGEATPQEKVGRGIAGKALQTEARAAGLPTGPAARAAEAQPSPTPQVPPQVQPEASTPPSTPQAAPPTDWMAENRSFLDRLKGMDPEQRAKAISEMESGSNPTPNPGEPATQPLSPSQQFMADNKAVIEDIVKKHSGPAGSGPDAGGGGSVLGIGLGGAQNIADIIGRHPNFALRAGLGAAGAMAGYNADDDNPLLGAAAGAVAGAAAPSLPSLLSSLGARSEVLDNLAEKLHTPEGIKTVAKQVWETLPQIQRANFLASGYGLPANAIFGPYGSLTLGALEKGLSGDSRGWEALRLAHPIEFLKDIYRSIPEAQGMIGRAEGHGVDAGASLPTKAIHAPGTLMTSGDLAARNILMKAGFSEEEARVMTLTSEPWSTAGKNITNLGRGADDITKPIIELMAPFRRTPVNIWEQGMERMPGAGFAFRQNTSDPLKLQLVQQLLGAGVMGVSGVAGDMAESYDPTFAKNLRRFVSNAGGPYALQASMGYAGGQAIARGKPVLGAAVNAGATALPLPTTEPVTELAKMFTEGKIPKGALPATVYDYFLAKTPATPGVAHPTRIHRVRRR